jgi:hypothetical protein
VRFGYLRVVRDDHNSKGVRLHMNASRQRLDPGSQEGNFLRRGVFIGSFTFMTHARADGLLRIKIQENHKLK